MNTTQNFRVLLSTGGTVKVTAADKETAAAAAVQIAKAGEIKRANLVRASNGPLWAQKADVDTIAAVSVRKSR